MATRPIAPFASALTLAVGLLCFPSVSAAADPFDAQDDSDELVLEDDEAFDADEPVLEDDEAFAADEPVELAEAEAEAAQQPDPADETDRPHQTVEVGQVDEAGHPIETAAAEDEDAGPDPAAYAAFLREQIASKRDQVSEALTERVMNKQLDRMNLVSSIFSVVGALGLLLLLMPLWLRKRYPGRDAVLWKYSALAALIFIVTINLFSGVFGVLRAAQSAAGQATNPQIQIVEATFDVIDENAEDLAEMGPMLIEPTLAAMDGSSEDPLPVLLLQNVKTLRKDLTVFESIATFMKKLDGVFGLLPLVLSLVTVVIFLLGLRQTLTDIVRLPIAAAAGEDGAARRVVKSTLRRVGREILATLGVVVVLVFVLVIAGLFMAEAIGPAIDAFIGYFGVSFLYLQIVPDASTGVVLTSLTGSVVFLALDLAMVLTVSALYVGKAHKILQRRLHDREPLRAHARFWGWGSLALLWGLAFPLVFVLAAQPVVGWIIDSLTASDDIRWGLLLTSGPLVLVLGFLLTFWAARGLKAITFLAKYRVPKLGTPVSGTDSTPSGGVRTGLTAVHSPVGDPLDRSQWS